MKLISYEVGNANIHICLEAVFFFISWEKAGVSKSTSLSSWLFYVEWHVIWVDKKDGFRVGHNKQY